MFLEISQNSQENTYVGVSFLIKLQACQRRNYPSILTGKSSITRTGPTMKGGHTHTFVLKSYFARDVFLEIRFCVILQGIQNFFGPSTPRFSSGALKEQNLIERSVKVSNNNGVWSAILPTLLLLIKYFLHISCINEIWSKLIINTSEECHGSDFCHAFFEVLLLFWPYLYFLHF